MGFAVHMFAPERDWFAMRRMFKNTGNFDRDLERAVKAAGTFLIKRIKSGIAQGAPGGQRLEPNAPSTQARKGMNFPLVETGFMLRSIRSRVRRSRGRVTMSIGFPSGLRHPNDPRHTVAEIAAFAEFGFRHKLTGRTIRRSFIMPVLLKEQSKVMNLFTKTFSAGVTSRFKVIGPSVTRGPRASFKF
jgi:hypothetical protein